MDSETIDEAIDWLNDWSHCYAIMANPLSTCESLLVALSDSTVSILFIQSFSFFVNFNANFIYVMLRLKLFI